MKMICSPAGLSGTVRAIPSKSDAHRKLICAALSQNGGTIPIPAPYCDDIAATIRCLKALGADIDASADGLTVRPIRRQPHADLDCGESGSTLRFLLPVAAAVCSDISVTGSGRLPERPIAALTDAMSAHGVHFDSTKLPLHASGTLTGGQYSIAGNISSQFLSGLLMALPVCCGNSEICLTTALQSSAYVTMTLDTLRTFGAEIDVSSVDSLLRYRIIGNCPLHMPSALQIDGDWSNAAFWLAAGALQTHPVTVTGLRTDSVQGDKQVCAILSEAGAVLSADEGRITVLGDTIRPFDADMNGIPDLLPILAVCAAFAEGDSHFTNAARLRLKESDRLRSVAEMLSALGGQVTEHEDGLTVHGTGFLRGGTVDAQNDHRLVMAAAIAALRCKGDVSILGAEAVSKSYPAFFQDYIALGGIANSAG